MSKEQVKSPLTDCQAKSPNPKSQVFKSPNPSLSSMDWTLADNKINGTKHTPTHP